MSDGASLGFERPVDRSRPLRILLLTSAYPPFKAVGAFRAEKVARAIAEQGHEVHVICSVWDEESCGPEPVPGVFVHPVRPFFDPAAAMRRLSRSLKDSGLSKLQRKVERAGTSLSAEGSLFHERESPRRFLSRVVLSALTIPDQDNGLIPAAIVKATALQRSMRFDLIYATAPPFSVHVASQCIHALSGVPWIAEYRDPWCLDPVDPRVASGLKRGAAGILRGWTMRGAQRHVTNSDGQVEWLANLVPEEKAPGIIVAKNGITGFRSLPLPREPGPFRIVYPGTVYQGRSPDPFFRALRNVVLDLDLGETDIEVTFIGLTYEEVQRSLAETAEECGVGHLVRFIGWVPGTEARRLIDQADCLLLLAQGWLNRIPNKLFDYLASRNPIIAYVDGDMVGDPDRILERVGGHLVVRPSETDKAEAFLKNLILDPHRREVARGREDILRELSTERQMEILLRALNLRSTKTVSSMGAKA